MDGFGRFAGTDAVRANLRERSVRGTLFTASGQGLDLVIRVVGTGVLARLLTPEYFGLIAMVTAMTGILEGVKDLGLATATMQRAELSHRLVTNLFWVNTLAGVLFAAAFCAASPFIAGFYEDPRLIEITMALSLTFVWGGASAQHEALMIRQLRQGDLAVIRLLANLVSFAAAIALALDGWGYWSLAWREVIRTAMIAFGVWIRCPWLPGLPGKADGTASLLRFGRDFSCTQLLHAAISNVDRLLIGKLFGAAPLGEYRLAHQTVVATIEQFNAPIGSVANPGLSMLQNDPGRYRRYYEKVVFVIALCTMPIAVYATVHASNLTTILFGEGWSAVTPYFAVFAASAFFRPIHGSASSVLISRGQSKRLLRMTIANAFVFMACLAVGYRWGPIGIAFAHLVAPLLVFVPNVLYAFAGSPVTIRGYFRAVRSPAIASVVMGTGLIALKALFPIEGDLAAATIGFATGALVYAAALMLVPGGRRDMETFASDVSAVWSVRALRHAKPRWKS